MGRHYSNIRCRIFTLHTWVYLCIAPMAGKLLFDEFAQSKSHLVSAYLLPAVLAAWTIWLLADKLQSRIALYHNGFIRLYPFGRQKAFYFHPDMHVFTRRWQYSIIFSSWRTSIRATIRLLRPDGTKFSLPATFPNAKLLNLICQYQFIHSVPRMRDAYNKGETLDFGGVRINHSGIFVKQDFFPWQEYEPKIGGGRLYIHQIKLNGKTKWRATAKVPLVKIAEVNIFLGLIGFGGDCLDEYGVERYQLNPFF